MQIRIIYAAERQKQDLIIGMMFLRDHTLRLCLDFKRGSFLLT